MSEQPFYSLKNPDFCMSKRASALLDSYDNKKQRPRLLKHAGQVNHNTSQSKSGRVENIPEPQLENVGIGASFKLKEKH